MPIVIAFDDERTRDSYGYAPSTGEVRLEYILRPWGYVVVEVAHADDWPPVTMPLGERKE